MEIEHVVYPVLDSPVTRLYSVAPVHTRLGVKGDGATGFYEGPVKLRPFV